MVVLNTNQQYQPYNYQDTLPPYCNKSNPEFRKFVIVEFGVGSLPPFLFFILGTVRYFVIKDYARGHCRYSYFFKWKVGISVMMGVFLVALAATVFSLPPNKDATDHPFLWINACQDDFFAFFYIF